MWNFLYVFLPLALLSADGKACRDEYRTNQSRLDAAEIAVTAKVSALALPQMEKKEFADSLEQTSFFRSFWTVRLVVINTLKGSPDRVMELVVHSCHGGGMAEIGRSVNAYKIGSHWRLAPSKEEPNTQSNG